jgi:hypothetical protein
MNDEVAVAEGGGGISENGSFDRLQACARMVVLLST